MVSTDTCDAVLRRQRINELASQRMNNGWAEVLIRCFVTGMPVILKIIAV